jgi:hypothetical protein
MKVIEIIALGLIPILLMLGSGWMIRKRGSFTLGLRYRLRFLFCALGFHPWDYAGAMFKQDRDPEWEMLWSGKYRRCLCCGKEQEDVGGPETIWKTLQESKPALGKSD